MQKLLIHPDYKNTLTNDWFDKDYWRQQITGVANGGRGKTWFFRASNKSKQEFVLRHYCRGGQIAKISKDKYWFTKPTATRSFAEFKLHSWLFEQGLPVAKPVAARFIKSGLFYTADYISEKIPAAKTLYQYLKHQPTNDIMPKIYQTIKLFHDFGLNHTDLNIHNILISKDKINLIDFDNCNLNATDNTKLANLTRLVRSLNKELPHLVIKVN